MPTLNSLNNRYQEKRLTIMLIIALLVLFVISLMVGDVNLSIINTLKNISNDNSSLESIILMDILSLIHI